MNIILPTTAFGGMFKIEKQRPGESRVTVCDWFPNLVLDNGLDMIGSVRSGAGVRAECFVGAGNSTPINGQMSLDSLVADSNTSSTVATGAQSTAPYFGWLRTQYIFNTGVAAGTLQELGVGRTATTLFSRALILDGGGNPTSITVLSDETLYVTYELRMYPPTTDFLQTETIDGVPTDIIVRAQRVTTTGQGGWSPPDNTSHFQSAGFPWKSYWNGDIGPITGGPSGTSDNGSNFTINESAYVPGSFTRNQTIAEGLTNANLAGGIRSMARNVSNVGSYQFQFDPPIMKDATKTLTVTTGASWTRHAP